MCLNVYKHNNNNNAIYIAQIRTQQQMCCAYYVSPQCRQSAVQDKEQTIAEEMYADPRV